MVVDLFALVLCSLTTGDERQDLLQVDTKLANLGRINGEEPEYLCLLWKANPIDISSEYMSLPGQPLHNVPLDIRYVHRVV